MLARSSGITPAGAGVHHAWVPWYAPEHIAIFGRPVAWRATSVAQVHTSDPFFANTVQSANGVIETRCSARSTHTGPGALKQLPSSICRRAASSTLGCRWPSTIGPYEHT